MQPDIIPSIFNWCDRWCERCRFADRCMVGLAGRRPHPNAPPGAALAFGRPNKTTLRDDLAENLAVSIAQAEILLDGLLRARGLDLAKIPAAPPPETRQAIERASLDLREKSDAYAHRMDVFFKSNESFFQERSRENEQRIHLGLPLDLEGLQGTVAALASLRWFQHFIGAKAQRAVAGLEDLHDWPDPLQSDGNGTAKICQLALTESFAAWETLRRNYPEKTDEILDLFVQIREIQRDLEAIWPDWRKFHRPGFDD